MEELKDLYADLINRSQYLIEKADKEDSKAVQKEIEHRLMELNLVIIKVQQIVLRQIEKKKA